MNKPDSEKVNAQKNALLAQVLLSLQEDDDNPYDVGDEMLVAFSEGKLDGEEAAVVQKCLANNPEAMAASVDITREQLLQQQRVVVEKESRRPGTTLVSRLMEWFQSHKGMTLAGAGSALATSFAFVLLISGSVYKSLDSEFEHQRNQTNKPSVSWGQSIPGMSAYPEETFQMKGGADDFFIQSYNQGIRLGLTQFAQISEEQQEQWEQIAAPAGHCNNVLAADVCAETLKQGRYLGQWVAMAYVSCQEASISVDTTPKSWIAENLESAQRLLKDSGVNAENNLHKSFMELTSANSSGQQCAIINKIVVGK